MSSADFRSEDIEIKGNINIILKKKVRNNLIILIQRLSFGYLEQNFSSIIYLLTPFSIYFDIIVPLINNNMAIINIKFDKYYFKYNIGPLE
jgi:hypothetical protein